ncbi:MAG: DNA alkylation repair protein [Chloroflexota bacterium]
MQLEEVIDRLRAMGDERNRAGMARFGIATDRAFGVSVVNIRKLAKETGKDHALALELWNTGIHEARILASVIDVPKAVTEEQMEQWVSDLDSWDLCDQCCANLFDKTPFAAAKVAEWSEREPEFEKRAAFSLLAYLAVHNKKASDADFLPFLRIIVRESTDERNFVKKAVNWSLRQIGKRNPTLNKAAIETAQEIASLPSRSARWIAKDALRELVGREA